MLCMQMSPINLEHFDIEEHKNVREKHKTDVIIERKKPKFDLESGNSQKKFAQLAGI